MLLRQALNSDPSASPCSVLELYIHTTMPWNLHTLNEFIIVKLLEILWGFLCLYLLYLIIFSYRWKSPACNISIIILSFTDWNFIFYDLIPKWKENYWVNSSFYLIYQWYNNNLDSQDLFFLTFSYYIYLVLGGHMYTCIHMCVLWHVWWGQRSTLRSWFFYHLGLWDQIQVIRLGDKHFTH